MEPGASVHLNHFFSMVGFALLLSIALGCLTQRTTKGRIKYGLWSFALFIGVGVGIAWLMYPFSR
jgi:hypothetical protein